MCAMAFPSQNNIPSIHHPVLLRGDSFMWVVQSRDLQISHTHPKSREPKVSVLRTHLYPSRCENPVGLKRKLSCSSEEMYIWSEPLLKISQMCKSGFRHGVSRNGERVEKDERPRKRTYSRSEISARARDGRVRLFVSSGVRAQDQFTVLHPLWEGDGGLPPEQRVGIIFTE